MNISVETIDLQDTAKDSEAIYKVELGGALDSENCHEFDATMSDLIKKGSKKIILDFSGLLAVDSMGIGILISNIKRLKKENGNLVITRCRDQVLTLLKPINIENLVKIFRNPDEGINYLKLFKSK